MDTTKQKMSNRDLGGMYGALVILGNRSLPSMDSDIKIGRMAHCLAPTAEMLQPAKQKAMAEFGESHSLEDLTDTAANILAAQMTVRLNELDDEQVEVEIPVARVTKADLPKEKSGDDGWKNGARIGGIVSDLGILFEADVTDEAKKE